MDIFQEVINCLENKKKTKGKNYNNHILAFDDLQIEEYINRGQQGLVLKVSNGIKRYFALKFYRPSDQSEAILKESLNNFRKEVRILASLSHKNIVKIFSGGYAVWEPSNKLWKIDSGFDSRNSLKENEVAYYLMDYIQGEDLSSLFPELSTDNNKKI
ncbi:MAG: hypothetical protein HYZ34_15595, partial [Ignavibacteriae bacterium]|nr:hypothetical protein [Ignavibacteriota bacterium]